MTKKGFFGLVCLVLLSAVLVSCLPPPYISGPPGPDPSYSPRPGYSPGSVRWHYLGKRTVDFGIDRDSIRISSSIPPLHMLMAKAYNNPVEIFDIHVVFSDGSYWDAADRQNLYPGRDMVYMNLPGVSRRVREVIFRYRRLHPSHRSAVVELFGR